MVDPVLLGTVGAHVFAACIMKPVFSRQAQCCITYSSRALACSQPTDFLVGAARSLPTKVLNAKKGRAVVAARPCSSLFGCEKEDVICRQLTSAWQCLDETSWLHTPPGRAVLSQVCWFSRLVVFINTFYEVALVGPR